MKLPAKDIIKPAGVTPQGGGMIGQIRQAVKEFKEVLQLAQDLRGIAPGDTKPDIAAPNSLKVIDKPIPSPPQPSLKDSLVALLDNADKKGHGDKTLGELLTMVSPLTLTQLKELLRNA